MNFKASLLLVAINLLFVTTTNAQGYRVQNGLGFYGGLTNYNIETSDFTTSNQNGWLIGAAAVVDLEHKWYNVSYNIQLAQNKLDISAFAVGTSQDEFVNHKLFTTQIALLGHLKLIGKNLTIDAGPMIQYNGDLDIEDSSKENYIVSGYNTLTLKDLSEVSRFNVNGAIGVSAGFDRVSLRAQYIYGFTNMLNKLNKQNFAENSYFQGNQSMLVFSAMVTF